MLSSTAVQEINQHLSAGDVAAALALVEPEVDLRTKELPAIDKKTLPQLATHLSTDPVQARRLAEAALHPNISVRRFVRKLVQGLKTGAKPLAKPLWARLDCYIQETVALAYSNNPKEAVLRREQVDVLDTAIELLRRCDLEEFLHITGELLVRWHARDDEKQRAEEPQRRLAEARGERIMHAWGVHEARVKAIFEERYAHLGLPCHELQRTSPRLWEELLQAVRDDPEFQRAEAAAQAAMPQEPAAVPTPAPQTLAQDSHNVSNAFREALSLNAVWQPGQEPSAEQRAVQQQVAQWAEAALLSDDPRAEARMLALPHVNGWQYLGAEWFQEHAVPLLQRAQAAGRDKSEAWSNFVYIMRFLLFRDGARQDAMELPETLTPEALRALKNGNQKDDAFLEQLAGQVAAVRARQEERQAAKPPAAVDAEAAAEQSDEDEEEDATAACWAHLLAPGDAVKQAAAQYRTLEQRIEALCTPPVVERREFSKTKLAPVERCDLLSCWRDDADWAAMEQAFREQALPRLFDRLRQETEAYLEVHRRRKPGNAQLSAEVAAALTPAEQRRWEEKQLEQERFDAMVATDDVVYAIRQLGGLPAAVTAMEIFDQNELVDYQSRHVMGLTSVITEQRNFTPADVEAARAIVENWERYQLAAKPSAQDREWTLKWRDQVTVGFLYKSGEPEHRAEALALVRTRGAYDSALPRLAREREDVAMLMPLVRATLPFHDYYDHHILALWDSVLAKHSELVPALLPELLTMLAEITDAKQLRMPQAMLERVDKGHPALAGNFELLARCVESPLPAVNRLALERLTEITTIEADWSSVCERASEKLWSENVTLAKDTAKFLGRVGAAHGEVTEAAFAALGDALSLNNPPLLEVCLRALQQIRDKQPVTLDAAIRERIAELQTEHTAKLGKLCAKLLPSA
jgi:hypothetical protein